MDKHFEEITELVLKRWIKEITNEKVNFSTEHWLLKIIHKQPFTDVLQENFFEKVLKRRTESIQNATFELWEKNNTGCPTEFL